MNIPTIPYQLPRHIVFTQPMDVLPNPKSPMILCKAGYLLLLFIPAIMAGSSSGANAEEWHHFAGLLVGAILSGIAGLGMLLLSPTTPMRQVVAARVIANTAFGLGLGSLALYLAGERAWNITPMLAVGIGFIAGLMGVGVAKVTEPILLRWVEKKGREQMAQYLGDGEEPRRVIPGRPIPLPPADTVRLDPPTRPVS